MEWREVVEHPSLKDLPFKIETNEWGKIIMAPASYAHGVYQGCIYRWLERHEKGAYHRLNALSKLPRAPGLPTLPGQAQRSLKSTGSGS